MNEEKINMLLDAYKPSPETVSLVAETPIVLLVGISGAGKDTIKHHLIQTGAYHHIVSHTTRAPRENGGILEVDGQDYHFITINTAIEMLQDNKYVEVKQYSGNVYGTSASEIQQAKVESKIAITDLEVQGVEEYKSISENVIALFILPPSYEEWQRRLLSRYGTLGVDPEDMAKRMRTAIKELEDALAKPYYHFIINDDLDRAVAAANMIAHNHDTFGKVDESVKLQAQELLQRIRHAVA